MIIGLAIALVYLIWDPFARGGSGINVYLLDEDLEPFAVIKPGVAYKMQMEPLGTLTYDGQEVGGLGFALWVKPSGGDSGIVTIDWTGWRYLDNEWGGSASSGSTNVDWGTETELIWDKLTDSWIQVTTSTLEIWDVPSGSYTLHVNYDVTATGAIDGVPKQATAEPSVDCDLTWTKGELTLLSGVNVTTLRIQ